MGNRYAGDGKHPFDCHSFQRSRSGWFSGGWVMTTTCPRAASSGRHFLNVDAPTPVAAGRKSSATIATEKKAAKGLASSRRAGGEKDDVADGAESR